MACATCGGGSGTARRSSGMSASSINRYRRMNPNAMRSSGDPTVVNVVPTPAGVPIPPNTMSENPATGVIPPQQLNSVPFRLEPVTIHGEDNAKSEAKGE